MAKIFPVPVFLFFSFYLVFMATSSGGFEPGDALTRFQVARSISYGQGVALPPGFDWSGQVEGRDGRCYSPYGLTQSLLMVPGFLATRAAGAEPRLEAAINKTAYNLLVAPVVSALALLVGFAALRLSGVGERPALWAAAALGFGTMFWPYGRCAQEENILALAYSLCLAGFAGLRRGERWAPMVLSAGAAMGLMTRWASVPPLLVFGIGTLTLARPVRGRSLTAGALLLSASAGTMLAYNHARFGSPWETGYGLMFRGLHRELFSLSLSGFAAKALSLILSPGRGVLAFSPMLAACVVRLFHLRERPLDELERLGWAAFAAALLFTSFLTDWTGSAAWGPRYLAGAHVFLLPSLGAFFQMEKRRKLGLALLAGSACWQLCSVSLPGIAEEIVLHQAGLDPESIPAAWRWDTTPSRLRIPMVAAAVVNTARGRAGAAVAEDDHSDEADLASTDFTTLWWWPFRAALRFGLWSPAVALAVSLGLLAPALWLFRRAVELAR